jgi:phage baseplate assembly protein V
MESEYFRGRVGHIVSVNPAKCRATVEFKDKDRMVSAELQLGFTATLGRQVARTLKPGTHVVCEFLGNGYETGFVKYAIYDEKNPPPTDDPNKDVLTYEDGTWIEYDHKEHKLLIRAVKDVEISAGGDIVIAADGNFVLVGSPINLN